MHLLDRMIYSGQVPWHGLGTKLDDLATFEDVRKVFCEVKETPGTFQALDGTFQATSKYKNLVRTDSGKLLCIMPATYGVVQYADACSVLEAATQEGFTKYVTAGLLDEGRRAWALASIPSATFEVAGSEVKPYLLLTTAHDGSLAIRYHFTGVYVVCNNTLTAALAEVGVQVGTRARTKYIPNVITLKHTKGVNDRLAIVRKLVEQATRYFGAFHERALVLVNQRYSTENMRTLAEQLFPVSEEQEHKRRQYGEESAPHKARSTVLHLFSGAQRAANNAPGTKWAAFNAVTEYVDHHQKRRGQGTEQAENRFDSILFTSGAQIRQNALDLLLAA